MRGAFGMRDGAGNAAMKKKKDKERGSEGGVSESIDEKSHSNSGNSSSNSSSSAGRRRRPSTRDLDLLYKAQTNRSLSSTEEFERKCERIRFNLRQLGINMKGEPKKRASTNSVGNGPNLEAKPKRFLPPLKLPFLSIFQSANTS